MGNDPKTSVTDKYGRIHSTPNLFVADASLHVTNGGFNPALTIMALGYWVGGHIASEWNKGNRFINKRWHEQETNFPHYSFCLFHCSLLILIGFGSFYAYWNQPHPTKTCASCHEIENSVIMFTQSAHRDLTCRECHGTALSNGFHSLKEKGMMVVNHAERIHRGYQAQRTAGTGSDEHCTRCHTSEYARWSSGGHSARYRDIFLDKKHNQTEQLNVDCLRCHGMLAM